MLTKLLGEGFRRAGLGADLPYVQILGIRQDRTSYLVYSADGGARVAHVKVASALTGLNSLSNEYVTLRGLAAMPGLLGRVPPPRAWCEVDGTAVSVVGSLPGRPLDVVCSRRRPMTPRRAERYASAVTSWLDGLHSWTKQGTRGIEPYREADLLKDAGVPGEQVRRAYKVLTEHADVRLPRITAHGDLWPGNILVDASGHVAVVDWETAESGAEPYDDLLFFLLTFVRATLPGDVGLADAATAGLLGGSPWRTDLVRRHLLRALDRDGVPHDLADTLVLLFLARRAVRNADRARRRLPCSSEWPGVLERLITAKVEVTS